MYIVYIDDSRDGGLCVFSGLAIRSPEWKTCFASIREYRRELKAKHGIYMRKEFHATEFVSGRGKISDRVVFKGTRCKIFIQTMKRVAELPRAKLFNAVMPQEQEMVAFERLLNRINRTMQTWGSRAILICDEGKESIYTRLVRKMGVHSPIPSQFGEWSSGEAVRNIPLGLILEDPIFKKSHTSYFLQLADFCAYALLRREVPLESKNRYGLHLAFAVLKPILSPQGIIR